MKNLFKQALLDDFIDYMEIKDSSKTTYRRSLKQFIEYCNEFTIAEPVREDVVYYKDYLQEKKLSILTINNYIVIIRKYFEWLEFKNYYKNISKLIKGKKRKPGFNKDPLTKNQASELLRSIDLTSDIGKRDYAIINLMIRTALRTIEVINADIGDIRQESGESVLWVLGKGHSSKDDFVVLTDKALKAIQNYLSTRKGLKNHSPLFISYSNKNKGDRLTTKTIRRLVKERLKRIGINTSRISAHSLRHTFATLALENDAPIHQIKDAMRHSNISTTMIYSHNRNRVKDGAEKYIDLDD